MRKVKLLAFVMMIVVTICFTGCSKENPWIPEVQGSHVSVMPYEDIDGEFTVEKYTDFKSFKKSELADYNFIKQRVAKDERYSKEFFETRDLAVIKFNYPKSGIDFIVADITEQGSECVVRLLPMPDYYYEVKDQETTYCCFIETQNDISDKNYRLEFLEEQIRENLNHNMTYSTEDGLPYVFDEDVPVAFKLSSPDAALEFVEYDEILTKDNYLRVLLTSILENCGDDKELLLVRIPSSSFENLAGSIDGGTVKLTGAITNHYGHAWEKGGYWSELVPFYVPKGFEPDSIERTQYNEYEDGFSAEQKLTRNSYTLDKTTEITDNVTRYDFK